MQQEQTSKLGGQLKGKAKAALKTQAKAKQQKLEPLPLAAPDKGPLLAAAQEQLQQAAAKENNISAALVLAEAKGAALEADTSALQEELVAQQKAAQKSQAPGSHSQDSRLMSGYRRLH